MGFAPFANQFERKFRFLIISKSMATELTFKSSPFVETIFGETYQRAPTMLGDFVKVFVVLILTRACTIIELGDTLRVVVIEYGWDAGVLFTSSPRNIGLSVFKRIITCVANHIEFRSIWRFILFICKVFGCWLAFALILIFWTNVLNVPCFILQEWNFGFSRLEN